MSSNLTVSSLPHGSSTSGRAQQDASPPLDMGDLNVNNFELNLGGDEEEEEAHVNAKGDTSSDLTFGRASQDSYPVTRETPVSPNPLSPQDGVGMGAREVERLSPSSSRQVSTAKIAFEARQTPSQEGSFQNFAFSNQEHSTGDLLPKSRYKKALEDKGWLVAAMVLGLMASYPLILKPTCQAGGDLIRRMRGISVPKVQG